MTDTTKPLSDAEREELREAWTLKMHGLSGPFPGLRLLADHDALAAELKTMTAMWTGLRAALNATNDALRGVLPPPEDDDPSDRRVTAIAAIRSHAAVAESRVAELTADNARLRAENNALHEHGEQ